MKVNAVLFDIGGVLTPDPYETIILHEKKGIGRHLGLTERELVARVRHIWDKYATLPGASENDFWTEITYELGFSISPEEIEEIKNEVVQKNPESVKTFRLLRDNNIPIGLVSNNTAFFYQYQSRLLSLNDFVDSSLVFLSQEAKTTKEKGLYELTAQEVQPKDTLVIDDRLSNIKCAKEAGFVVEHYAMNKASLFSLVSKYI